MNGEIAAANQRLTSPAFSARQGAVIAFQHSKPSANVTPSSSVAAAAAVASAANANVEVRRHQTGPESGPEVGTVKDKIGRFTNQLSTPSTLGGRPRTPSVSILPAPEQIAARLAAGRSPKRTPETASDAARLGAIRSASRMQSQSRPAPDRQELRSPTPVRPSYTRDTSMDILLKHDPPISRSNTGIGRAPSVQSRAGGIRSQTSSPLPSINSQLSSTSSESRKPKLPPRSTGPSGPSVDSLRKPIPTMTSLRSSTPSMISISGQPHISSASTVDESGGMNEEALSNAIVASSLASARATSVTKIPPTPPRRRRARSLLQLNHSPKDDLSRTPSPPKGMPQTLRGIPKFNDAEASRGHKIHLLHKHPHKHHEGDRKRWRREVTEKERKRYEGVWASNKGLLIPPGRGITPGQHGTTWPPPTEMVLNLVVREIWSRSRLPTTVLEQVWALVDHQQIGLLTKEEFVVGMWLIDQQLKGHKLPMKVPDSVWDSVRYVTGIKLSTVGKTHA